MKYGGAVGHEGDPAPAFAGGAEDGDFTRVLSCGVRPSTPVSRRASHAKLRAAASRCIPIAFMTVSRFLVSLVAAWLVAGMAAAASPTLERIKASGTVTFGYREGAAPFSAKQRNGKVRGYSVEL